MIKVIKKIGAFREYQQTEVERGDTFIDAEGCISLIYQLGYNSIGCVCLTNSEEVGFPLRDCRKVDLEIRVIEAE